MRRPSYLRLLAGLLVLLMSGLGCALFAPQPEPASRSPLQPLVAPRNSVELEIFIVDRTVGDPLIGTGLWNSLHNLTSLTPEVQQKLSEQGFRVAMSPSCPPHAVQALLTLSEGQDPTRRTLAHRVVVPAGQMTILPVTVLPPEVEVDLPSAMGLQRKVLHNGSCLLQVRADKVAEGWATLEVLPVLQHGTAQLRAKATPEEWQLEQGQQMISLYDHRFHVELNEGELVVLGYTEAGDQSVGERFFRGDWKSVPIERLVILRLRDLQQVDAVRAEAQ